MSTRALLIRKTPGENTLQWGQTKWDGYANTYKLNRHWNTPDLVEQLFERLVKEDRGISSLGYDMEDTVWYEDGYNCGSGEVDLLEEEGVPSWQKMSKWFHRYFDWPEYTSVWFDGKWYDFETCSCLDESYPESEKHTHADLAHLLSYMQGMLADYPDIEHRYKTEEEEY
jgi:hypothetical protein